MSDTPEVVDQVALARLYGEPLFALPQDLYIPPDALEVFLEAFEGPLDLLLYLIRKQNFNILDIPMLSVTKQYLVYVEQIRKRNLELAAEYLLMAAMLIEIKSRMLLPPKKTAEGEEAEEYDGGPWIQLDQLDFNIGEEKLDNVLENFDGDSFEVYVEVEDY